MASAQQARDTSRITEEGKATINEQAKEAQAALQAKCKLNRKGSQDELVLSTGELVLVTGVMKNLQRRGIMLQKSYDWKGQFISKPPDKTIGEHADGAFVHQGAPSIVGSKGAMIYGHFDHASPKLGWLLAWCRPDSSNELNKASKYTHTRHSSLWIINRISWIGKVFDCFAGVCRSWEPSQAHGNGVE